MALRDKLYACLAIPCLMMLVVGMLGLHYLEKEGDTVERIHKTHVLPIRELKAVSDAYAVSIIDAVNKANSGLMTAEQALASIEDATALIDKSWQVFSAGELEGDEAKLSAQVSALFKAANRDVDQLTAFLRTQKGMIPGELKDHDGALYKSIDPITKAIDQLINTQFVRLKEETQTAAADFDSALYLNMGLIFIGFVASLVAGTRVVQGLTSQLGGEPSVVAELANRISEGDLDTCIDMSRAQQGSGVAAMDHMARRLREIMEAIHQASLQLQKVSAQVAVNSRSTQQELHSQKLETEQVVAAVNQMASTVHEVAKNAQGTANAALSADKEVSGGMALVDNSMKSIIALSEEVEEASSVIQKLASDSSEIGQVLAVIRSIAEQTNLLALNAAIEAARAGEQGRGFAVVADEVRSLAQRTHTSTEEIQTMIQKLQNGVANAVTAMDRGRSEAQQTVVNARLTQAALSSIGVSVSELKAMNLQIAAAAEEQTNVAEEINRNIININNITHSSIAAAGEVTQSSEVLQRASEQLDREVSYFNWDMSDSCRNK